MNAWLPEGLTDLENAVLTLIVGSEGDLEESIRHQLAYAVAGPRTMTGVGFYRNFILPDGAPMQRNLPRTHLNGISAEHPHLDCGATFILFVRDGVVAFLEGVTFEGDWPGAEDQFTFFVD